MHKGGNGCFVGTSLSSAISHLLLKTGRTETSDYQLRTFFAKYYGIKKLDHLNSKPTTMTSNEISKASLLDIVFDNRNKQYGAYTLRKYYSSRLSLALGISMGAALLTFFLTRAVPGSGLVNNLQDHGTVVISSVELPKALPKPPEPPAVPKHVQPPRAVAQQKLVNFHIVEDKKVFEVVPELNSLDNVAISNKTVSGPEILPGEIQPPVTQPSSGNGNAVEKQQETYMDVVEKEPEFPGGILAWQRFLSRNLMTPEGMESGERKTVQIRFQVAADGAVTSFEVLQSGGKILDNEVIRVLKMMPRWKPAIQNGHPVARSFTQPVTFIGAEE